MARHLIRAALALLLAGPAWGQANRVGPLQAQNNLSDVSSVSTVRTNLGLGTAALKAASGSGGTVASVTGSFTIGHIATFADTVGTVQDGGAAASGTITGVTAGAGLSGGGTSGTVTVNLSTPVSVANGGTGLSSGTSGGVLAFTASGTLASSGALTANAPVIGGGAGAVPSSGSRSGNTTTFATTSGTLTSGNCIKSDASGNLIDAGATCGGGGGGGGGSGTTRLVLNTTSVGNGPDTTEDTGQSYTMAGGTFTAGWIEINAAGTFAASANSKSAAIYFGATKIGLASTATGTVTNWRLTARVYYVDSTHQWVEAFGNTAASNLTTANTTIWQQVGSITADTSASIVIKTTIQNSSAATANTVVSQVLLAQMFQ